MHTDALQRLTMQRKLLQVVHRNTVHNIEILSISAHDYSAWKYSGLQCIEIQQNTMYRTQWVEVH